MAFESDNQTCLSTLKKLVSAFLIEEGHLKKYIYIWILLDNLENDIFLHFALHFISLFRNF